MANVILDPDKMDQLKKRFETFRAKETERSDSASATKEEKVQALKEAMQRPARDRTRER